MCIYRKLLYLPLFFSLRTRQFSRVALARATCLRPSGVVKHCGGVAHPDAIDTGKEKKNEGAMKKEFLLLIKYEEQRWWCAFFRIRNTQKRSKT